LDNGGYGGLGAERLFADFLNAARNGKPVPTPIEDLVHVLQIGEAMRESSNSKRSISILPI
jgi:predicted dehydrogenase